RRLGPGGEGRRRGGQARPGQGRGHGPQRGRGEFRVRGRVRHGRARDRVPVADAVPGGPAVGRGAGGRAGVGEAGPARELVRRVLLGRRLTLDADRRRAVDRDAQLRPGRAGGDVTRLQPARDGDIYTRVGVLATTPKGLHLTAGGRAARPSYAVGVHLVSYPEGG